MIVEMFVKSKSEPDVSDNVEHVIASLPVTVKLIDADDDVAAVRANVTVGAVVSGKVVDVVVVVSLLPELLLGAVVVVVAVGGATVVVVGTVVVVVELVVGTVEVVDVAGAANHFTGWFCHQHTPVRGHRNTPESLSAHARISLVKVSRASRVPLNGH